MRDPLLGTPRLALLLLPVMVVASAAEDFRLRFVRCGRIGGRGRGWIRRNCGRGFVGAGGFLGRRLRGRRFFGGTGLFGLLLVHGASYRWFVVSMVRDGRKMGKRKTESLSANKIAPPFVEGRQSEDGQVTTVYGTSFLGY